MASVKPIGCSSAEVDGDLGADTVLDAWVVHEVVTGM